MSGAIEALYIYDEHNVPILEHIYRARPPSASTILPLYLAHPAPRPSLVYLPSTSPPVTVFSIVHSNLLFLAPSDVDSEPLLVLEFLHRVIDVLEEFIGAPLLPSKLQANYDVIAQLLIEMCDAGIVCNTEPNALQENVEVPGWMGKLLGGVVLPGTSSPSLGPPNPLKQSLSSTAANVAQGPAIPWRRPGVRHTSNELYVDIIESLSVTIAPSGRLLSALVSGTIAFTAKISGVPDLLLSLSTPGGQQGIARKIELPVFHPCVRLARWRERPGELSFVPPDGRFILAGYEVNLLPIDPDLEQAPTHMEKLFLPTIVDIRKSLGPTGQDFEVRLILNTDFPGSSSSRPGVGGRSGSGSSTPSFLGGGGSSSSPVLEEVVVTIPISKSVRNITDMRPSRGETQYQPGNDVLEWRVPTKDAGTVSGTATLHCTVVGHLPADEDLDEDIEFSTETGTKGATDAADRNLLQGYYDADSYQAPRSSKKSSKSKTKKSKSKKSRSTHTITTPEDNPSPSSSQSPPPNPTGAPQPSTSLSLSPHPQPPRKTKIQLNATLMPTSASVSFSVRGWLPSGVRVDGLMIDPRRSRGIGESVRPYKGVKYLCVSQRGIERRC